ncbi:MAG: cytochrome ubiquinol oxidase subunit I [Chlamydia sp.]
METEILHRIQFAFTITFHYIYPPLSIGLSLLLIIYEGLYLKTKSPLWENITKFWTRVFALTFALGIATGIPLMFSFGTNWSRYSKFIGDVLGSALAAEGLFAFGVEAGFLGIVLFGWGKVSKKMHFFATCMVSVGAHFSGFWIVSVNSWMHTPAGYAIVRNEKGVESAVVTDWLQMIFNPSNMPHQIHVILGAWLSGALLVVSVSAYYLLKNRWNEFAISSLKVAGAVTLISAILQLAAADRLGKVIARENPTKMAAFEGLFKTEEASKIYLFGIVDTEKQKVHGLGIPGVLSFLVHNDFKTPVKGLDQSPREEWPHIQAVFQMYHIMVATWGLIFIASLTVSYMWYKNRWKLHRFWMLFLIASVSFPQIGNITGWYSSCMGRQPWTVHKLLKTKDAYSPSVSFQQAVISLSLFVLIYLLMFFLFLFLLDKKIKHGPTELPEDSPYRDPFKLD